MTYSPRPFLLSETNWESVQKTRFDLAVLPWGATEAHNYHLPYATDNYQVEYVAEKAAELAWAGGTRLIVLPCIPFGVNTGQLDIPLCMNIMPSTQLAILKDVCDVLQRHGIRKFIVLNGHGGNNFVSIIRELSGLFPEMFISVANWYQAASREGIFEHPGDHADEMETSVMMAIQPGLVLPLERAGDGSEKNFQLRGFKEKWAWSPRPWTMISADTGTGYPKKATIEKGKKFSAIAIEKLAEFFAEFSSKTKAEMLA
ncbi:creatininase family protein [Pollutibacter soli]|uniref:creatininase family protein n=1 Tax=Pollutibacter soli TaxID=3034157 RepID=UPI003013A351